MPVSAVNCLEHRRIDVIRPVEDVDDLFFGRRRCRGGSVPAAVSVGGGRFLFLAAAEQSGDGDQADQARANADTHRWHTLFVTTNGERGRTHALA